MRVLGSIFLCIALGLVGVYLLPNFLGSSYESIREDIAKKQIRIARDYISTFEALRVLGAPASATALETYSDQRAQLVAAEQELLAIEEARAARLIWHMVPAGILAMVGLILLVVPVPTQPPKNPPPTNRLPPLLV